MSRSQKQTFDVHDVDDIDMAGVEQPTDEEQPSGTLSQQPPRTCINFKVENADVRYHDFGWIKDWNDWHLVKDVDILTLIDMLTNFVKKAATDLQTCRQQYGSALDDTERKCLVLYIDEIKKIHFKYRELICVEGNVKMVMVLLLTMQKLHNLLAFIYVNIRNLYHQKQV